MQILIIIVVLFLFFFCFFCNMLLALPAARMSSLEARPAVGGRHALVNSSVGEMFFVVVILLYLYVCKMNLNICWRSLAMLGIIGVAQN